MMKIPEWPGMTAKTLTSNSYQNLYKAGSGFKPGPEVYPWMYEGSFKTRLSMCNGPDGTIRKVTTLMLMESSLEAAGEINFVISSAMIIPPLCEIFSSGHHICCGKYAVSLPWNVWDFSGIQIHRPCIGLSNIDQYYGKQNWCHCSNVDVAIAVLVPWPYFQVYSWEFIHHAGLTVMLSTACCHFQLICIQSPQLGDYSIHHLQIST